jgi:adenylate cyclase
MNRTAPRAFSERDEYLLSALADYAAIALQNARTFQETDNALSTGMGDLRSLVEIIRALTSSLELKKVVQLAVRQIHESWQIEASSLWLVDKRSGGLRVLANVGTPAKLLKQINVPLGRGFVGHVAQTGSPIYTNSVNNHPLHYSTVDHKTGFRTRSLLCLPLMFGGVAIGALQLLNKLNGEFDEQDLERAMAIATAVAIGVTNANLYRQSELRRQQLYAILEHSPNLILFFSETNQLLLLNERARERLDLGRDAIGRRLDSLSLSSALIMLLKQPSAGLQPQTATIQLADNSIWQATLASIARDGRLLIMEQLPQPEN